MPILRVPYTYSSNSGALLSPPPSNPSSSETYNDETDQIAADEFRDHNMAIRYRLYNRLDPGGEHLVGFIYFFHFKGPYNMYYILDYACARLSKHAIFNPTF